MFLSILQKWWGKIKWLRVDLNVDSVKEVAREYWGWFREECFVPGTDQDEDFWILSKMIWMKEDINGDGKLYG